MNFYTLLPRLPTLIPVSHFCLRFTGFLFITLNWVMFSFCLLFRVVSYWYMCGCALEIDLKKNYFSFLCCTNHKKYCVWLHKRAKTRWKTTFSIKLATTKKNNCRVYKINFIQAEWRKWKENRIKQQFIQNKNDAKNSLRF